MWHFDLVAVRCSQVTERDVLSFPSSSTLVIREGFTLQSILLSVWLLDMLLTGIAHALGA